MLTGRRRIIAIALLPALLAVLPGCAQSRSGGFLASRPRTGSLKENLSRMDYQNQQLRRELASTRNEKELLAKKLESSEVRNMDLATRLDNYRNLVRGQSPDDGYGLSQQDRPAYGSADNPTTRPIGREPRDPPWTQIPYQFQVPTPPEAEDDRDDIPPAPTFGNRPRPYDERPQVEYFDLSPSRRFDPDRHSSILEPPGARLPIARSSAATTWQAR
ncbi:hypothetical protein BH23PLA1_BH23PLA1_32310 [soil metagenome]